MTFGDLSPYAHNLDPIALSQKQRRMTRGAALAAILLRIGADEEVLDALGLRDSREELVAYLRDKTR
jgi:hypothetical protein